MNLQVVLYGKPGCCLCDECEMLLRGLQNEFGFTLQKVDISRDEALRERWKCHIPVVTFNGRNRVALRISEARLRRALLRAQRAQAAS
jgi:glutaredoxin